MMLKKTELVTIMLLAPIATVFVVSITVLLFPIILTIWTADRLRGVLSFCHTKHRSSDEKEAGITHFADLHPKPSAQLIPAKSAIPQHRYDTPYRSYALKQTRTPRFPKSKAG